MQRDQDSRETKSLIVVIAGVTLLGLMITFVVKHSLWTSPSRKRTRQKVRPSFKALALQSYNIAKCTLNFLKSLWGEMTRVLEGESLRGQNPSNIVFLAPSRRSAVTRWAADSWGTPLSFTIQFNTVRVWSSGPNKKDEKGKGDDLLVEFYSYEP